VRSTGTDRGAGDDIVHALSPQEPHEPESLRERKKAATRLALSRATVELSTSKGLDAVTVEAIADHANVSRRTFSNYFANKEEALLYGERLRYEHLVAAVSARPADESAWQALRACVWVLIEGVDELDPERLTQMRLVRKHPSLAASQLAMQSAVERDLAEMIVDRAGSMLRARLVAALFLATVRVGVTVWMERADDRTAAQIVDAALDDAAAPLSV